MIAPADPTIPAPPRRPLAAPNRVRTLLVRAGAGLLFALVTWRLATWRNEIALAGPMGQLRPCGTRPNCVTTESDLARQAMPLVPFTDAPEAAQARARAALLAEPRTRIVSERRGYLHAETTTRLFRFVDDVEIVVDANARVFRFRSASRRGNHDAGVNRKRMQRVSARLQMPVPPR